MRAIAASCTLIGMALATLSIQPDRSPADARIPIKVRGLEKRYGATQVLHGISFDVHEGELFGLLGTNGAEIGRASCRERVL